MTTLLKINKENKEEGASFTPEYIQSKLFYFHDAAHKFHLDTKSFEIHKAMDFVYNEMVSLKDDISEKLIGYQGGKRIGKIKIQDIPDYSDSQVKNLAEEIKDFGYELYEWAGEKKYCDIENIAQSLSGVGAKTIYLLTLT